MKQEDTRVIQSLFASGLPSNICLKAAKLGYTLTKLKKFPKRDLSKDFGDYEIEQIRKLARKPIEERVVDRLIKECDWKCCICWDIHSDSPVIIHHIEKHSKTQDDSYENLVILCLNHHGHAHSKWEISQHLLPPGLIRERKGEWIEAVSEFKDSTGRPGPATWQAVRHPPRPEPSARDRHPWRTS